MPPLPEHSRQEEETMSATFDFIEAKGSRYEIGLQVGEATRGKIQRIMDQVMDWDLPCNYRNFESADTVPLPLYDRQQVLAKTAEFLPLFQDYCPDMLDELRGIARGAQLSFEEALFLQIRGEILYVLGGCSSFVFSRSVTREKQIIAGQNWDNHIDGDLMVVLHAMPDDEPAYLTFTFAGLTSFMGINAAGVGQFANSLPWGDCTLGIPHYPFKWRIFQQTHLAGIRAVAESTQTVQPGNYVFCDGSGAIADLELTPEGCAWPQTDEGFFVHTNHFLADPYASRQGQSPFIANSRCRYARFHALVSEVVPQVDLAAMQRILADHENYPSASLCRHEGAAGIWTVASLIAEPERGLLHVCAGNPCQGKFETYSL
jgi:isopenicillin-N N-acyltransferase like protein